MKKQKVKYNRCLKEEPMTTIIGIRCQDGVVLAANSQSSFYRGVSFGLNQQFQENLEKKKDHPGLTQDEVENVKRFILEKKQTPKQLIKNYITERSASKNFKIH